ncbi:hypothetical protein RF11_11306 [Thelohanellus kitauei]|uniref:BPTI/Kunitz inhibitor domain-containing protein n=1 Tax=Thelohanellus kitauei TaxID=669202 RepID=A0A0C2MHS1_THEKT|nr:hypothetical protein RF11_11306 [Thelohanellus kitauei]
MCGQYQACGPPNSDVNMFWKRNECRAQCASPIRLKRKECMLDWGEPYILKNREIKSTKKAFNKWTGMCDTYIKRKGYPTPPLFTTLDECDEYCLIDPEK